MQDRLNQSIELLNSRQIIFMCYYYVAQSLSLIVFYYIIHKTIVVGDI